MIPTVHKNNMIVITIVMGYFSINFGRTLDEDKNLVIHISLPTPNPAYDSPNPIHVNTPPQHLSNNPVFLIVERLSHLYLYKTKDEKELDPEKPNSSILARWLEKELAGDRTALTAALKYIVDPLWHVEYENGFGITDDNTTQEWLIKKLKKCNFSKEEIKIFMEAFPHKDGYPLNDFLKKYVVNNGLILLNRFMKSLEQLNMQGKDVTLSLAY